MIRRVGRPGLVGTMARTAVVAGTASATVGAMNRRRASKDAAAAQAQAPPPPPPPAAPAPAEAGDDTFEQLQKLADLNKAGVLDDDEFAAAKAKLLANL